MANNSSNSCHSLHHSLNHGTTSGARIIDSGSIIETNQHNTLGNNERTLSDDDSCASNDDDTNSCSNIFYEHEHNIEAGDEEVMNVVLPFDLLLQLQLLLLLRNYC